MKPGETFVRNCQRKGIPIVQEFPPLQGLETKSDWNDLVKQQREISLGKLSNQSKHKSLGIILHLNERLFLEL